MKVYDKDNRELKIGDTVHYKRPETTREVDMGNGRTKTMTRPAKDVIFTIDTFVDSPFVRHGGHDPRMDENRIWISGPELDITLAGSRNSVSPLAVVKIDTMVKKKVSPLNFTKVGEWGSKNLDIHDAFTSDKPSVYKSFLNLFR